MNTISEGLLIVAGGITISSAGSAAIAGAVITAVAGVVLLVAQILPSGDSEELIEIRNQFRALNSRIDQLGQTIERLFFQLRLDFADSQLDDLNNVLGRIRVAYTDYIEAATLTIEEAGDEISLRALQANYREAFR